MFLGELEFKKSIQLQGEIRVVSRLWMVIRFFYWKQEIKADGDGFSSKKGCWKGRMNELH